MRQSRSLEFEDLEDRKLLSRAHTAVAHAIHAAVVVPLQLNGTLTVDQKGVLSASNVSGGTTTSTPVSGQLGGVGEVRGAWNQSVDSFGQYVGPDTLVLHNAKGSFVIVFNSSNLGKGQKTAEGTQFNVLPQKVLGGSRAYAKATETGTIQFSSNAAESVLKSMKITSKTS